jgi:hypothetical protein
MEVLGPLKFVRGFALLMEGKKSICYTVLTKKLKRFRNRA